MDKSAFNKFINNLTLEDILRFIEILDKLYKTIHKNIVDHNIENAIFKLHKYKFKIEELDKQLLCIFNDCRYSEVEKRNNATELLEERNKICTNIDKIYIKYKNYLQ